MRTLYVTDLDGTLLNTHDRINQYSLDIINDLVDKGILVRNPAEEGDQDKCNSDVKGIVELRPGGFLR